MTVVIGLTGSIGMGKTLVTAQFAALGAKTCNADDIVHGLLAQGGAAVAEVGAQFPGVVKDGAVDRQALGKIVFADGEKRKLLEGIIHPKVIAAEEAFVARAKAEGVKFVVLDIPLLFETGGDKRFDKTVVVSAPHFIQRKRVLRREGMTEEKFARILASQMPDKEKRQRADFVVQTGFGRGYSLWQVRRIVGLVCHPERM